MWQIYRPLPLFVAVAISPVNTPRHTTRSVHTQPPKAKLNGQKGNIWAAKENTAEGKTAKVQKKYLKYFFFLPPSRVKRLIKFVAGRKFRNKIK